MTETVPENSKYQIRNQKLRRGDFCLVKSTFLLSLDISGSASERVYRSLRTYARQMLMAVETLNAEV